MPNRKLNMLAMLAGAVLLMASLFADFAYGEQPQTLADMLRLSPDQLQGMDVARMNLLCAEGLPGAENLDVEQHLKTLDGWADRVRFETLRNLYRYQQHPEEFERSEACFRMLVLITVLQRDLRVRYNPDRISTPTEADLNSGAFFADSSDVFLHGLLGDKRMGTCASIPVLYVAVGRRLGYPLRLVRSKGHVFVRWESADGKERLNIEGGARGLVTHPDEYYRTWPFPMDEREIREGQYLWNQTAAEELAEFLVTRACCFAVNGRASEAREMMSHASRLAPKIQRYAAALHKDDHWAK